MFVHENSYIFSLPFFKDFGIKMSILTEIEKFPELNQVIIKIEKNRITYFLFACCRKK